jgi:tRNA nucleotidyltransferase (CCA-adding enzyme)
MSEQPSRMLGLLVEVGAAQRVMPELVLSPRVQDLVNRVAQQSLPLASRYAVLSLDTSESKALAKRLRVPSECVDMARLLPLVLAAMLQLSEKLSTGKGGAKDSLPSSSEMCHALKDAEQADAVLSLFETCDALRKPERFEALLQTAGSVDAAINVSSEAWQSWLQVVLTVDAGAAARSASAPDQIKQQVRAARLVALQSA